MTDLCKIPDAADRWRATIEALEQIVLDGCGEPETEPQIDSAAAEDVRHLVMVRLAAQRRCALPAAWVRRPWIVVPGPADAAAPAREMKQPPLERRTRSRPAWRD
jgi:hypothetical protein